MMESGEIKMRFGRCPYCRTMIYQNPEAVIFFCSKCRTPIRGKNPVPTEEIDLALSSLEILSVDTASMFSDELDACHDMLDPGVDINGHQHPFFHQNSAPPRSSSPAPDGGFGSARRGLSLINGFVDLNGHDKLRPFSRRTRRPASGSDSSVLRYGMLTATTDSETEEGFSSPRNACERQRRRRRRRSVLLGSQALETSIGLCGQEEPHGGVAPSPLALGDPAFNSELVNALDSLRVLIAAIQPASSSSGSRRAFAPPRDGDAHLFRRLESQLSRALHIDVGGRDHRRNASSTGSSSSSSSSERRKNHCRPVLGGAPFLVCGSCSQLLQAPATTPGLLPRGKVVRLRCGGCEEVLDMTAVTAATGAGGSSLQLHTTTRPLPTPAVSDSGSCNSGTCGDGALPLPPQPQPLHRALGYSSPSPLLRSRRY